MSYSASAGDVREAGSILGLGRYPGGQHGNLIQYSCLENPMDRGAWQATAHRVAENWTQLNKLGTHARLMTKLGKRFNNLILKVF